MCSAVTRLVRLVVAGISRPDKYLLAEESGQLPNLGSGEYSGVRECHVSPDWLLIYDREGPLESGSLKLIRTGSHSELF